MSNALASYTRGHGLDSLHNRQGTKQTWAEPESLNGRGFEPWTSTNTCGYVCRYVDQKGSAAMLISIQSAGVTPEVNRRITQTRKHTTEGSILTLKPRADQTSPEVENRGMSGPTKRTHVLQKMCFCCQHCTESEWCRGLWGHGFNSPHSYTSIALRVNGVEVSEVMGSTPHTVIPALHWELMV